MELRQRFHFDEQTGATIIESVQDCEPIMEQAKRLSREGIHGSSEMRHVARLPFVIVEKYCNEHGITYQEWNKNPVHVERMLADPDLAYFRVAP